MGFAMGSALMQWATASNRLRARHAPLAMAATTSEVDAAADKPPQAKFLPITEGVLPLPQGPEAIAAQCLSATLNAYGSGILRQRHELLLPLIGATDLDDWPGGVRQQFKAMQPMMEQVLKGVKEDPGLQGPLKGSIIDMADAIGCWEGDKIGAVVFPTAETLPKLKEIVAADKLCMMVNSQWQGGQVVSDFGWGPFKKANEEFVDSFEWVYYCRQVRINGDTTIVQRAYPGKWQVHVLNAKGERPCVSVEDKRPSYQRLEEICRGVPGSMSSMSLGERLVAEWNFNIDSMQEVQNYNKDDTQ